MKCMYAQTRPRFILSSEGVLGGMELEPMLTPREKSPLPKISPEEDRTRNAVDSEPKHYHLSYSGPQTMQCLTTEHDRSWQDGRRGLNVVVTSSTPTITSIINVIDFVNIFFHTTVLSYHRYCRHQNDRPNSSIRLQEMFVCWLVA